MYVGMLILDYPLLFSVEILVIFQINISNFQNAIKSLSFGLLV